MNLEPENVSEAIHQLLDGEPTTGQEWLSAFMQAQGQVAFNTVYLAFSIGQAGMAMLGSEALKREMLTRLELDINDLEKACGELVVTARRMHANALERVNGDATG